MRWHRLAALVILAALPLGVLALWPAWGASPTFLDPYLYIGYFLDLPGHLAAFPKYYVSTRLPVLLPGWVLHSLLPPVAASVLLRLGLFYLSVFSLYAALARSSGRRAGLLAAVLLGTHFFFLGAVGTDYADGYAIAFLSLALMLLGWAAQANRPGARLAGAGAVLAAAVFSNVFYGFFVALAGMYFLGANAQGQRHPLWRCGVWLALGAAAFTGLFALASVGLGGRWLFFLANAEASVHLASTHTAFRHRPWHWLSGAVWLVLPISVGVGGMGVCVARRREGQVPWPELVALGLGVGGLLGLERFNLGVVRFWYYVTPLLPFALLAVGRLVGKACAALSLRAFAGILGLALMAGLAQTALRARQGSGPPGLAPFLISLALGLGAFAVLGARRDWEGSCGRPAVALVGFVLLFSASQAGARAAFRYEAPWPEWPGELYDRIRYHDRQRLDVLRSVADVVRAVSELGPPAQAHYWFRYDEPLGMVYREAACTSLLRIITQDFPMPGGALLQPEHRAGGLRVAVLGERADVEGPVADSLAAVGLAGERRLKRTIHHGHIRFTLTVYDVRLRGKGTSRP
jgi:hypothetical protein